MLKGIFITGTDTDVGKTLVSASLAWKLSKDIKNLCVMKPFATAERIFSEEYNSEDVAILLESINSKEEQHIVNPYFYDLPCSPYMASELLNLKPPSLKTVLKKYEYLSRKYDFVLVEGIGGIMVPINKTNTLIDFIKITNLKVIIVATPRIGTFNHIMLTVSACKSRDIPIKGIIINKMPESPTQIEMNMPYYIEKALKLPILGVVPFISNIKNKESVLLRVSNLIKFDLYEKQPYEKQSK